MRASAEFDGDDLVDLDDLVELLASHGDSERALLLGNVDRGWVGSLGARGRVRQQDLPGDLGATQIYAGARIAGERGEVLVVGRQPWWGRLGADAQLKQGKFELEGVDPIRTLDTIVALVATWASSLSVGPNATRYRSTFMSSP